MQEASRIFFFLIFFEKLSHYLPLDQYNIYFMLIHLIFFLVSPVAQKEDGHAANPPPMDTSGVGKSHLLICA